jgi:hypothetical protein
MVGWIDNSISAEVWFRVVGIIEKSVVSSEVSRDKEVEIGFCGLNGE